MRLSHGWYGLIRFWLVVLALFGAGAGTLQVLGPPQAEETAAAAIAVDDPVEVAEVTPADVAEPPATEPVLALPEPPMSVAAGDVASEASPVTVEPVASADSEPPPPVPAKARAEDSATQGKK